MVLKFQFLQGTGEKNTVNFSFETEGMTNQ